MFVHSESLLHSSFRENYEDGFEAVVFESAPAWIEGLWIQGKHLFANIITHEVQF